MTSLQAVVLTSRTQLLRLLRRGTYYPSGKEAAVKLHLQLGCIGYSPRVPLVAFAFVPPKVGTKRHWRAALDDPLPESRDQ